ALIPLADVALHRQRPPTHRANLVRHLLARVALAARPGHVGARFREPERRGATKTLAAPSDDHDLAGRVQARNGHRRLRRRFRAEELAPSDAASRTIPSIT